MNQNQIDEPVQVRVAVIPTSGVEAAPTSNTGAPEAKPTITFVSPLVMTIPSFQIEEPTLTAKQ